MAPYLLYFQLCSTANQQVEHVLYVRLLLQAFDTSYNLSQSLNLIQSSSTKLTDT